MASFMEIALVNAEFTNALNSMQQNSTAVSSTDSEVAEITCRADTLRRYRQSLSQITALIVLYKALLEKDRNAVAAVQMNMVEKDKLLQGKFSALNPVGGGIFGVSR